MFLQRFISAAALIALLSLPVQVSAQEGAADTAVPSDVERLSAMPGNGSVYLKWDIATDDVGVTGYKIYYGTKTVNNKNTNKYETSVDAGDAIEYTITGLKNGTAYYFAVTSYDGAENESDYYSPEVNVMPDASLFAASILSEFGDSAVAENKDDDSELVSAEDSDPAAIVAAAPKVVSVEAVDKDLLKVVFSEKITLPEKDATSAFVIQDDMSLENLAVISAKIDSEDPESKTVLVGTDEQIPGMEYTLTAGPEVTDSEGNSILSGKEDAAPFTGVSGPKEDSAAEGSDDSGGEGKNMAASSVVSDVSAKDENGDEGGDYAGEVHEDLAFGVSKIEVLSDTIVVLTFPQEVILSLDPLENFSIYEKDHPEKQLPITIINTNDEGTIVTITTGLQNNGFYTLELSNIRGADGELLGGEKIKFDFQGKGGSVLDTTPPEDVRNLVARALKDLRVRLNWKGSINSAGDLLEYILYQSTDSGGTYGKLLSMPKEAVMQEITGLAPGEYFFKVTAKDASGNESQGKTVKVRLVETGPGLGLIGFTSVVLGRLLGRRKRRGKQ